MSSDTAISVRGLSKSYTIAHETAKHVTLAESTLHRLRHPFQRQQKETFWALNDVSFDIKKGDVVGIIGRNGAGKSTLLKILSRITEPTKGEIDLYGRIGSLLEVGTGFHPELTGRENIYVNGQILGMRKREIDKEFDAIVDFSGVEQFLDTPVKRYSSGMYVRLAFAVAAHLTTDIMVVDEVLAVGDTEFQNKCLGKIKDVARNGRTVLFVSHNIGSIKALCSGCIVLKRGKLLFHGDVDTASQHYFDSTKQSGIDQKRALKMYRPSWAHPHISAARMTDVTDTDRTCFPLGSDITFEMGFCVPRGSPLSQPIMGVVIHHAAFGTIGGVNNRMTNYRAKGGPFEAGTMRCILRRFPFLPGRYTVDLWLGDGPGDVDVLYGYLEFEIEHGDVYGTGRTPFKDMGVAFFDPEWKMLSENYPSASRCPAIE